MRLLRLERLKIVVLENNRKRGGEWILEGDRELGGVWILVSLRYRI